MPFAMLFNSNLNIAFHNHEIQSPSMWMEREPSIISRSEAGMGSRTLRCWQQPKGCVWEHIQVCVRVCGRRLFDRLINQPLSSRNRANVGCKLKVFATQSNFSSLSPKITWPTPFSFKTTFFFSFPGHVQSRLGFQCFAQGQLGSLDKRSQESKDYRPNQWTHLIYS